MPADVGFVPALNEIGQGARIHLSKYRNETSRLSCQIAFTDELDGLKVTIADED